MDEMKKTMLTKAGKLKMEEELNELKNVARPEIVQRIKEARAQGDLSENAEYSAAKEEQGKIEGRIAALEELLKTAEVVDSKRISKTKVTFGCRVLVHDETFDEDIEYSIVGSDEADPMQDRISNESPVGEALMGAKVGDTVHFATPGGDCALKVIKILGAAS